MKNSERPASAVVSNVLIQEDYLGLSKREYFAGLAMQGMLSNRAIIDSASQPEQRDYLVKFSIEIADELLKQLESNEN
jgi:hypothetical protein